MRMKILRGLVIARRYANTSEGEKKIVLTLTAMSIVFVVDVTLLIIGEILK